MRIQDTNAVLNEAKVLRKAARAHEGEVRTWASRLGSLLRDRRVQPWLLGAAAGIVGAATLRARRNRPFAFRF